MRSRDVSLRANGWFLGRSLFDDPEELGAAVSELFVDAAARGHGRGANTNTWAPGDILSRRPEISNTARQEASLGALVLLMRAEWRRGWRAWLALVLLVAFVGGVVLGAMAAGRRTDSALPSFLAAHGFDADVYSGTPWPSTLKVPEVTSITELIGPDSGQPTCACMHPINPTAFGVIFEPSTRHTVFKLVSGHLPDPSAPDQVLASFTLRQDYGVHLGSVITVPFYSRPLKPRRSTMPPGCHRGPKALWSPFV